MSLRMHDNETMLYELWQLLCCLVQPCGHGLYIWYDSSAVGPHMAAGSLIQRLRCGSLGVNLVQPWLGLSQSVMTDLLDWAWARTCVNNTVKELPYQHEQGNQRHRPPVRGRTRWSCACQKNDMDMIHGNWAAAANAVVSKISNKNSIFCVKIWYTSVLWMCVTYTRFWLYILFKQERYVLDGVCVVMPVCSNENRWYQLSSGWFCIWVLHSVTAPSTHLFKREKHKLQSSLIVLQSAFSLNQYYAL